LREIEGDIADSTCSYGKEPQSEALKKEEPLSHGKRDFSLVFKT
jgi:hypothetical protein